MQAINIENKNKGNDYPENIAGEFSWSSTKTFHSAILNKVILIHRQVNGAIRANPAFYKEKQQAELSLCVADGVELVPCMQAPLHTHPYMALWGDRYSSIHQDQLQDWGRDKFRVT